MTTAAKESKGHVEHTKSASLKGLRGEMRKPIKVTMLGAGSRFTPRLVKDVVSIPGNKGGEIAIVDIDEQRLAQMDRLLNKLLSDLGLSETWKVIASVDRRSVLPGTDYIVNCIEVSGLACVRLDNDIPAKYGINQCIGDTIGPGGLFKALRTVPVYLEVLKDAEELCPQALVLNYTNPMNIMMLAGGRTSSMQAAGLCHSVQGTGALLAKRAGIPFEEMDWQCAGINHLAWFTKLEHKGKDLYPQLKEMARKDLQKAFAEGPLEFTEANNERAEHHRDLVRKDMMLQFGAFITESSGHLSEYLPYYRKRPDLVEKYARPGYDGETSFYANNWPNWRATADKDRADMLSGVKAMDFERSWEYASWIIEAHQKDVPYRIYGNVMNNSGGAGQLITNLPADGCVEVACLIDQNGITPTRYGALPRQMAALCVSNMSMFDLAAQACIEKSRELATYALKLDPLTAAVCSPAEIQALADEMFEAQAEFLPDFK